MRLHCSQAAQHPERVRPHASALLARTRPCQRWRLHQSCLSWRARTDMAARGQGLASSSSASTSHRTSTLLIEQGDGVRTGSAGCRRITLIKRPRAAARPSQVLHKRPRSTCISHPPSINPSVSSDFPEAKRTSSGPLNACRSSRIEKLDFIAVDKRPCSMSVKIQVRLCCLVMSAGISRDSAQLMR